jgi:FkbM family methyltransferase
VTRFIDVGANDGFSLSNTVLFALRGAHGLCFEPNPIDYRRLRAFYLTTRRVECFCEALSDRSGTMEFRSDGLLSSLTATEDTGLTKLLAPFQNANSPVITVLAERLSIWLDRRPDYRQCDVISIDVEGHELNVLLGMDWERYPNLARCLILETHSDGAEQSWLHRDYHAIDELLSRQGYFKLAASANNTFWVRHTDLETARVKAAKSKLPRYKWFD